MSLLGLGHRGPMSAIELTALTKRYGKLVAVNEVSFSVEHGETFVLLGPNGAGKSTIIEILEGFRSKTSGEARVLGVEVESGTRHLRSRLGIVVQSAGDLGRLSVAEIIKHFASMYPNPRDVDSVIAAVGLEGKAGELVRKLSGGQQHRVDVALGLIGNPEVLFLDEPTTGFDPEVRREFWDVIRGLQSEGTTIMLTTHYLDEAEVLGHRGGVIVDGELVALGKISELGGIEARQSEVSYLRDGELVSRLTDRPAELVQNIAAELGGEPERLQIRIPNLESVYLELLQKHSKSDLVEN